MKTVKEIIYKGERALFAARDLKIDSCVFAEGESPLKEGRNLDIKNSLFQWKYPLWYCKDVKIKDSTWFEMARAGVWYTEHISVKNSVIQAPKNFRRCEDVSLTDVSFTNALETLWECEGVKLKNVTATGAPYFAMNSEEMEIDGLILDGNYAFDGAEDVVIRNSRMLTKDAFWNTENVTVYDSFIAGEYLGWNAKNLTLINCTIESLQGMCYVKNLVMKNCKLINTTLAFEYSSVEAEIDSRIESVFNPSSGSITAKEIGELIIEPDKIDPEKTKIVCKDIEICSTRPEWMR